jgi:hypothetical protein
MGGIGTMQLGGNVPEYSLYNNSADNAVSCVSARGSSIRHIKKHDGFLLREGMRHNIYQRGD